MTEKVRPRWGLLITAKSRGWGLLNFLPLRTLSWIGSCKIPGTRRLSVALQGGLVTKDGGHCSRKDLRCIFCTHVQGECDIVSIFILCILIQMNISIHLRYCSQKLARGGLRILKGWGCSSEILNQTPKGDRFGRGPSFF